MKKLIIVTPIYEDIKSAEKLFRNLKSQFDDEIFIVAIDDGSVKKPLDIDILNNQGIEGVILSLVKNVGHQHVCWSPTCLLVTNKGGNPTAEGLTTGRVCLL